MADSVLSKRGKRKLIDNNHVYTFSKTTADQQHEIWACEKRSTCKGRVWTQGLEGPVVKVVTEHNHAAQAARPEALQLVDQIRQHATTTSERPQQITLSNKFDFFFFPLPRGAFLIQFFL